ncbi:MAG: hypothetical protein IKA72_02585 [Clostridia bacterium]|nr:hypothetical protein [Clostridia bacterium]
MKCTVEKIKIGEEGTEYKYYNSITAIEFDENDETAYLPPSFNGEPICWVGYKQDYAPAYERWHDWQHPSQGSEWVEAKYTRQYCSILVPAYVKKIILPATIKDFPSPPFKAEGKLSVEVSPDNPHCEYLTKRLIQYYP